MFRCENKGCGKMVPPRTPINFIVTERREKTYENPVYRRGKPTKKTQWTKGWEIANEIKVCPGCFQKITGQKPQATRPAAKSPTIETRSAFKDRRPHKKKPWRNPKNKKRGPTQKKEEVKPKKVPIVEKINPIKK